MLRAGELLFGGHRFHPHPTGALWWPDARSLIVADLHFDKSGFLATFGHLLPPYDTLHTLRLLQELIDHYQPRRLICLGDSFHDVAAYQRMGASERGMLARLMQRCEWLWLTGNHDPVLPDVPGSWREELREVGLHFLHMATPKEPGPRLCGHFHPSFRAKVNRQGIHAPCFVHDTHLLVLPSFGTYTGGLNIHEPALRDLFKTPRTVHLCWRNAVYRMPVDAVAA